MRKRRALERPVPLPGPARVLIVSASMGAGHDGAARSLAEQLRAGGHTVEVRDFLLSGPLRIGSALRKCYELELKHVPSAYDLTYRFWYRVPWLCPLIAWLVTGLTRRRVMRWVNALDATVVVSTYPLATLCLGRLRRTGRLTSPAINFITDFGVHPLWVHRGVDINLTVHNTPAEVAARRTGRRTEACGPAVSARFDPERLPGRAEARSRFGIGAGQRAVLVVAGSWGVGNVRATFEAIACDGRFLPVVVCGRDERLRRHVSELAERSRSDCLVLGWTEDMPALMVACDVLVENAGGLTSLEAMRVGLPVVSFDPIAGHGRENTAAMDAAGVARLAPDASSLAAILEELTSDELTRRRQVARAEAMFRRPPSEMVAAMDPDAAVTVRRRGLLARSARAAVAGGALTGLAWAGMTTGVAMATQAGAGVARPAPGSGDVAYIGVRLNAAEISNPAVVADLRHLNATAVVNASTAENVPSALLTLAHEGVSVANGGVGEGNQGGGSGLPWDRARRDARAGGLISDLIHEPVTVSVPGRSLNAWDLIDGRSTHTTLVVPNHVLRVAALEGTTVKVQAREIYLVDGSGVSPTELNRFLRQLDSVLGADQLAAAPLSTLS